MTKLQQLENAIERCGGDFATIHGYISQKNIMTVSAQIRLGCDYMTACHRTLQQLEEMRKNVSRVSLKYGISVQNAEQSIDKKHASIIRTITGQQTKRTDTRETVATTKTNRTVVKLNKAGDAIQIHGYRFKAPNYDRSTLPPSTLTGQEQLKKALDSMVGYKCYSLGSNNFLKFTVQGLTITPQDSILMVQEFRARQKASA